MIVEREEGREGERGEGRGEGWKGKRKSEMLNESGNRKDSNHTGCIYIISSFAHLLYIH